MKLKYILTLLLPFISAYAQPTPEEGLKRLMEGNLRFSQDQSLHPDRTSERRKETKKAQSPFAIILGCSDSRVSPEILFDQGIGDLFIVRVAGNVAGVIELASIEYAALYLHTCVLVVLGHENCGAIEAVISGNTKDIQPIADLIKPAIEDAKKLTGCHHTNTIKTNVCFVAEQLKKQPKLKKLIDEGSLLIKGGYYNFHTGKVELL